MLFRWIRGSIGRKLVTATLLLLAVVWCVSNAHTLSSERESLLAQFDRQGAALCGAAADFCSEPLLIRDYPVLDTYLQTMVAKDDELLGVRVERADGKIVSEARTDNGDDDAEARLFQAHVRVPGATDAVIGKVVMERSTRRARDFILARGRVLVLTSLGSFVCLAVLLSFFLRRWVSDRIKSLVAQAERFGAGDLEHRIALGGGDELTQLAESFDRTRINLRASQREIEQQNEELKEVDRTKDEFLATMSHEIRTPMNGVIGMAGLLLDTTLDEEQTEYAQTIRNSADGLLTILNDILDFSKIQAGKLDIETVDFGLRSTIGESVDLLAELAASKQIELAYLVDGDVPNALRGDTDRLRQVLTNLIANGIKFTSAGQVVVRVSRASSARADVARVRFEVEDTGIGIRPEAMERLFDRFSQADGSTTRRYGGTGLGLAISKQLVALMGGEIGARSRSGEGSTFWFELPLALQPDAANATAPPWLHGLRALVVDESTIMRTMLESQLRSWGIETAQAASGAEAVAAFRAAAEAGAPYRIVVAQRELRDLDAPVLTRRLREVGVDGRLAIVTVSDVGRRLRASARRAAGVDHDLVKPVRQSRLFDCLATLFGDAAPAPDVRAGTPSFPGLRVLVAEDNAVNQRLARRMLEKRDCDVEIVANGREAVDRTAATSFDLVLMDCQMPEMDGLEATRAVRARGDATPIVAMTANALVGDRERCLDAGMDDYLSKPVRTAALDTVLARYAAARSARA